jgi:hypothetical protein
LPWIYYFDFRRFKPQLNSVSLLQVLVCLAVMVGVALPQDDYDHYFGGPRPSPSPSIPNEGNQDTGRYAHLYWSFIVVASPLLFDIREEH